MEMNLNSVSEKSQSITENKCSRGKKEASQNWTILAQSLGSIKYLAGFWARKPVHLDN